MSVPYNDWLATLMRKAAQREQAGLRRSVVARKPAIDLAGNDYLGLSSHPRVIAAASEALSEFGLGATGSRLVRGTTRLHQDLEQALAEWIGTERALVFSSGYLANLAAIRALAGLSPQTLLVSDTHNHASMIDGCKLSRAETVIFAHADAEHAESLLQPGRPNVILTESVFSVDGDVAPLADLHAAARANGALLMVDDAHGFGVTGAAALVAGEPDVVITATLSKALGGAGGVVAGPAPLIEHLIDTGRTFIFDTALPPAVVAGVLEALDIARGADDLRAELHRRAALLAALPGSSFHATTPTSPAATAPAVTAPAATSGLPLATSGPSRAAEGYVAEPRKEELADASYSLHTSDTHIPAAARCGGESAVRPVGGQSAAAQRGQENAAWPRDGDSAAARGGGPAGGVVSLIVPSAQAALAWATACRERGVAVGCFRPPSTPDGRSRLRLTVNAGVPEADFMRALEVIEQCRPS